MFVSSVEVDCSSGDSDNLMEVGSQKRLRSGSYGASFSKACWEKLQRNRLNERFLELVSVLDPGRLPETDKGAILTDAVCQLQSESKKLKETIESLQANIKELKAEKSELRDGKRRQRVEREKLEQQVIAMSTQNGILPHSPAISTAFAV
ncbi:PREDICTED: transcription factor ILR3-like [Prunus mume]|uniref:Transcription factor ILR3-like n=1 Tax=Prunus mume TaxID=102107 RepID=A0ABM1LNM3_PRUMU|nr:PREDICTED: transcription factor ILR3-like [Prunus mume]